jgi:hypothetical protein
MRLLLAAALLTVAAGVLAEEVDNCSTVLGSLSIELRFARELPPGKRTTFTCARRYTAIVGASRQRVLRALGPPDRSAEDGGWSYFFLRRHDELVPGTPELVFHFGGEGEVASVDCRRSA